MAISLRSYIKGEKVTNKQVTIRKPALGDIESYILDDLEYDNPSDYYKSIIKAIRQHGLYIENNLEIGIHNGKISATTHYLANIC